MNPADPVLQAKEAYERDAEGWAGRGHDKSLLARQYERIAGLVGAIGPVLDLGCGPGFDTAELKARGLAVVGLDITRAMLNIAGRRLSSGAPLVQGDSRCLPFAGGTFAGVWASASLLHLPKSQVSPALREVRRVLQDGGVFYSAMKEGVQDGLDQPTPQGTVKSPRYFAHYRAPEWASLLENCGFSVTSQQRDADRRPGLPDWITTFATAA